jgi:hypothetical protein
MLKFDDGSHCHWTYQVGEYRSFTYWPSRDDVSEYLAENEASGRAQIVQIHGANCFCEVGQMLDQGRRDKVIQAVLAHRDDVYGIDSLAEIIADAIDVALTEIAITDITPEGLSANEPAN